MCNNGFYRMFFVLFARAHYSHISFARFARRTNSPDGPTEAPESVQRDRVSRIASARIPASLPSHGYYFWGLGSKANLFSDAVGRERAFISKPVLLIFWLRNIYSRRWSRRGDIIQRADRAFLFVSAVKRVHIGYEYQTYIVMECANFPATKYCFNKCVIFTPWWSFHLRLSWFTGVLESSIKRILFNRFGSC